MSEQQTKDQIAAVMLLHGTAEQQKSAIEYCSTPIAQPAPQGVAEVTEIARRLTFADTESVLSAETEGWWAKHDKACAIARELEHAITAIITERDEWKERYLQVTAQTARAEDRVEALHASIATLRAKVEGLPVIDATDAPDWHTVYVRDVLALIYGMSKCELCGEPMPAGEEMFKYHGYSGPCPKPPLSRPEAESQPALQGVAQVKFKRREVTKNWTTFIIRCEDADQAEALLNGTAFTTERDALRARVAELERDAPL